jgi:hypothetical protein
MPGNATAGTPILMTAVTRSGDSDARHRAHIPPSEVPTIGTRSRPRRVEERGQLGNGMSAKRAAPVVIRIAEAEARQIDGERPAASKMRQQRRPRRARGSAAVDDEDGLAGASLEHVDGERRLGEPELSVLGGDAILGE